jgi:hypothetical protein
VLQFALEFGVPIVTAMRGDCAADISDTVEIHICAAKSIFYPPANSL